MTAEVAKCLCLSLRISGFHASNQNKQTLLNIFPWKVDFAMSSTFTFSVLCPSGHTVTVKAGQNDPVLKIVEETCKKRKIDPNAHRIKTQSGKMVDSSLSVRFANLANRSNLELVEIAEADRKKDEGRVTLCLQPETGTRWERSFRVES